MGNIISAIHDDIDEYIWLCKKYGEKVQYKPGQGEDCYGEHARALKKRRADEFAEARPGVKASVKAGVKAGAVGGSTQPMPGVAHSAVVHSDVETPSSQFTVGNAAKVLAAAHQLRSGHALIWRRDELTDTMVAVLEKDGMEVRLTTKPEHLDAALALLFEVFTK